MDWHKEGYDIPDEFCGDIEYYGLKELSDDHLVNRLLYLKHQIKDIQDEIRRRVKIKWIRNKRHGTVKYL